MKIKSLVFIAGVLMACSAFVGCASDEPIIPEITIPEGSADYFSEAMDFPASGGSKIINFTSNVDWSISVADTQNHVKWCKISPSKGSSGQHGIAVTVEENKGFDDRNVVFVFTAGNISKSIIVNQKQRDALTLTTDRFEVDSEGGRIDVEVKANVDYKIDIPEECQDWIRPAGGGRALSAEVVSFDIAESTEYDKREGKIIVSSGELSETIKVYQAGSAILVLSKNVYTLGSEGGSVSVDISSNFEYEVDLPEVDWIKPAPETRAVSSHTLWYDVSPNTTPDDREAVIVFKDAKSGKRESVTIKQRQKDALVLSDRKVEIVQDGGVFSVDVNSNVDYAVEISSACRNWISATTESDASTRGMVKSSRYFHVAASEEYDKREGEIYFKYKDLTDTLRVYQSGGAVLVLSNSDYELKGGATTISVELKSNIEYTVSTSADWISEISTRAVSNSTKKFKIATNKTGKSRSGKIVFVTADQSKTATVNITQASMVEAKSLQINFHNTSGTIGGLLYIGSDYYFDVSATPEDAETDFEWEVEDSSIASIAGSGSFATLSTLNFGNSRVIVTEKNSGVSASCEFGTSVLDFKFEEHSAETRYGLPVVRVELNGKHQLKYSCTPSYATRIFADLRAFNFKEVSPISNSYVIVEKSSVVDIDENGVMIGKKLGNTIIDPNNGYGVVKAPLPEDGIYVEVVEEISPYGSIGGHQYVDLDLPSGKLWSTKNFGAWEESGAGSYEMWYNRSSLSMSWGHNWNVPTTAEFDELLKYCSCTWTMKNGASGYLFTGKNGATMFLPAAGFRPYIDGYGLAGVQGGGSMLLYWTDEKSRDSWEGQDFAFTLSGDSESISTNATYNTTAIAGSLRPIVK